MESNTLLKDRKLSVLILVFFSLLFIGIPKASAVSIEFSINTSSLTNESILYPTLLNTPAVVLHILTDKSTSCKYSATRGLSYDAMEGTFEDNFETLHKKTFTDLSDGVYRFAIRCKDTSGVVSNEYLVSFHVSVPIQASITLSESPPLKAGKYELVLTTTKIVSDLPSLSYSYDGNNFITLPLSGSGMQWKGFLIIDEKEGQRVGSFKFSARDLEGQLGSEIKNGNVFLVDTLPPGGFLDIRTLPKDDEVHLEWNYKEPQEVDTYRIYRGLKRGVSYTDYYKSTTGQNFIDKDVSSGTLYYYKVSAVDQAGNEGPLSSEVQGSSFAETSDSSSSISPETRLSLDSLLTQTLSTSDRIRALKLENQGEEVVKISNSLSLSRDISSALSELNALQRELEGYKTQPLPESELIKKIDSGEIKLSAIKKKVPESITGITKRTSAPKSSAQHLSKVYLEAHPETLPEEISTIVQKSLEAEDRAKFSVAREGYTFTLTYLSGESKGMTLIIETFSGDIQNNENLSLYESIPRKIASSVSDLNIRSVGHGVVKEDLLLSLDPNSKDFIYSLNTQISLESIDEIQTLLITQVPKELKTGVSISGFFSSLDSSEFTGSAGFFIGGILILTLFGYLFIVKKSGNGKEFRSLEDELFYGLTLLSKGEITKARQSYVYLQQKYLGLTAREKKKLYPAIVEFQKRLASVSLEATRA